MSETRPTETPKLAPSDADGSGVGETPGPAQPRTAQTAVAVPRLRRPPPGTPAGIEYEELIRAPGAEPSRVTCTDYSPGRMEVLEVADTAAFLGTHRPTWSEVRWIHVEGLQDHATIRALAEKYQLHPLAIEDTLDGQQRPKADDYPASGEVPGRLFVVARRIRGTEAGPRAEQVTFFLGRNTLLSFQPTPSPSVDAIRRRIASPRSRLREHDVSFLLYSLLDDIVNGFFPLLEEVSSQLEAVEEQVLLRPNRENLQTVHRIKRDLVLLRRVAWPMRELVTQLQREPHECLSAVAQTYFRDLYDDCVQVIDLIETYREIASAVADTYVSIVSNRTNDIMKVLTVIGTIFIPLTFLAGVYGMNMSIPENEWPYSYGVFWVVCLAIAGFMLWRFRRGGWL
jgi:magnesium transporter